VIALLADIHANIDALEACLRHARAHGARRHALLGDLVGYGAEPGAVVDLAATLQAEGAVVVKGKHDEAVESPSDYLNEHARAAIDWTRSVLGAAQRRFLATLPLEVRAGDRLFVHASANEPARWRYVDGPSAARASMAASGCAHTFCGHVHEQRLYFETAAGEVRLFRPSPGTSIPVPRHRRWLAVAGSAGQPRDGDPRAAYALFDPDAERITFERVPYDHLRAARKMQRAGLPHALVYRMERGI
jgi:diadenosine tetraphosphatase ApaH/serine/threonine PP2A family protein phosphatase